MIFLCNKKLRFLIAIKPATNKIATAVLITALMKAKICTSKGNSIVKVNLLKKVTAVKPVCPKGYKKK